MHTMKYSTVRKERIRKVVRSLTLSGEALAPPRVAPRASICTTLKGVPWNSLQHWIDYHLSLGFVRLFLYFDDPSELIGLSFPDEVTAYPVNNCLRDAWSALGPAASDWLAREKEELQARQALNALHALAACHSGTCTHAKVS